MTTTATAMPDGRLAAGHAHANPARIGLLFAVAAYGAWGVFPLYFKAVASVPALEVVAHRIIWSLCLLVVLVLSRPAWRQAIQSLATARTLLTLAATTALIAGNWLVFVWAVAESHLLQASLGYFINPLINVLLGFVFLRERLTRGQTAAVVLAGVSVTYLAVIGGQYLGVALFLAGTFGLYGLLRKTVRADAILGLAVETALLTPIAAGYLVWLMAHHQAVFGASTWRMNVLLMLAGPITALPLMWFAAAARRLRLATMGFIQYLAPTGHFLVALAYGEQVTPSLWLAFAGIWVALVLYTWDAARRTRVPPAVQPPEWPPKESA